MPANNPLQAQGPPTESESSAIIRFQATCKREADRLWKMLLVLRHA